MIKASRRCAQLIKLLAACLLVGIVQAAAPPTYSERHNLDSAGDAGFVPVAVNLPSVVTAIAEDRQGFLWLGTGSGLFRWDGYRATTPTTVDQSDGTWNRGQIHALATDSEGLLWVATDQGLVRQDPKLGRFAVVSHVTDETAVPIAMHADDSGGMWVGTKLGLMYLQAGATQLRPSPQAFPPDHIFSLLVDRRGTLWVGTVNGLSRLPKGASSFQKVPLGTNSYTVDSIAQDSSGRIWVGGSNAQAFVLDEDGGSVRLVTGAHQAGVNDDDYIVSIVEAKPGEMWFGLKFAGLLRVEPDHNRFRLEHREDHRRLSLAGNEINALLRGSDGRIWVSFGGGLAFHYPQSTAIRTIDRGNSVWQLRNDNILWVLQVSSGHIWLSNELGGIEFLDSSYRSIGQLQVVPRDSTLPPSKRAVRNLSEAPDGSVWASTELGVYRIDAVSKRVSRVQSSDHGLVEGARRIAWVGAKLYVGGSTWLRRYRLNEKGVAELEGKWPLEQPVTFLYSAGSDSVLIGTATGLWQLDTVSDRVMAVPPPPQGRNPGSYVTSIVEQPKGRLWVGGFLRGIAVDQKTTPVGVRLLGTREGLLHDTIDCMLVDHVGAVWVATDEGLMRIDSTTLATRSFLRFKNQGLGQPSYWSGSCALTASGDLLFGGRTGLTVVRPSALLQAPKAKAPVITEITVDEMRWQPQGDTSRSIRLAHSARMFGVEFTALNAEDPERQRYEYRLLGFEQDWVETPPSRRLASYTNLPPGSFQLQLRTRSPDSAWSEPTILPINVAPAWYEQGMVRAALLALGLATILTIVHLRTMYLRRRADELSRLVAGRTKELRQSQEAFRHLAYFDPVTGLPNRNYLMETLQNSIDASRGGQALLGVLFIDLDRFKWVNDSFGHAIGDQVLRQVAERLREGIAESFPIQVATTGDRTLTRADARIDGNSLATRFGGDEYVVVLPALPSADAAVEVAQRLQHRFAPPFRLPTGTIFCGASIGISIFPFDGEAADALLVHADMAMYKAKLDGRNRVTRFSPTLDLRSRRRTELAGMVATAREEGRLRLHCQLIVNLRNGEVVGYEALLRMLNSADGTLVSPLEFIPVAEELGVIQSIGLWAIEQVLQMLREWPEGDPRWPAPRYISVNVSPLQLLDEDFPAQVSALLRASGVPPERLVLEMTESCLMDATDRNLTCVRRLHDLGLPLSIDDFGTGYSSLSSIKNFPFSVLKIDRVFVRDVATDLAAQQLVAAIIAIAAVYDLAIVAEGVETEAQATTLRRLQPSGTLCAQGYLYGKPAEVTGLSAKQDTALPATA